MESSRIFNVRSTIWAVILLSTVVTCYARMYDMEKVPWKRADLQQATPQQVATGIEMWHGKPNGLDSQGYMFTEDCLSTYGFVPCSEKAGISAVLFLVFGFVFYKADVLISEGIDRSLSLWDGRLPVTPVLMGKTLPALFIIVAIAFARNPVEAEVRAQVAVGLLAGTIVLMLTLVWGMSVVSGRRDFVSDARGWSLTKTGVKIPGKSGRAVFLPLCVLLPYLIIQIPVTLGWSDGSLTLPLCLALSLFGLYFFKQGELEFQNFTLTGILEDREQSAEQAKPRASSAPGQAEGTIKPRSSNSFWMSEGGVTPDDAALRKVFFLFAGDNETMSRGELSGFIVALGLMQHAKLPGKVVVDEWMKKFDRNHDGKLSVNEFVDGMKRLYLEKPTMKDLLFGTNFQELKLTLAAAVNEFEQREEEERDRSEQGNSRPVFMALFYVVAGIAIAAFVSIPLVDRIEDLSKATGISPVLISFVAIPLLLNIREGLASAALARRKRKERVSQAFSKIYGQLFRNSFLPLAVLMLLLLFKPVKWDFLPEVLLILIAYVSVGIVASVRTIFPLWIGVLAVLLYPVFISLEVVFHLYLPKF